MQLVRRIFSMLLVLALVLSCTPAVPLVQAGKADRIGATQSKLSSTNTAASQSGESTYLVGYAVAHINPTHDGSIDGTLMRVGLSGYGNHATRIATSVDPDLGLIASILAVTDAEGDTVLIISCDSASVSDTIRNQAVSQITAQIDIPAENIMINSNHQHSTPTGSSTYNTLMAKNIAEAAVRAMDNRTQASVSIARAYVNRDENGYLSNKDKFNYVRNYTLLDSNGNVVGMATDNHSDIGRVSYSSIYHESEADDEVQLVRFEREGASTVIMANFQTHPHLITGGSETVVTSDIIGVFRNELERSMETYDPGTDYEIMYISGASGNINAQGRGDAGAWSENSDYARTLEHARILPNRTFAAITKENAWTPVYGTNVQVVSETNYYRLILNTVPDRLVGKITVEEMVAAAKEAQSKGYSSTYRDNYGIYSSFHANAIVERENWDETTTKPLSIAAYSIGDVAFVSAPYEMFDTNGQQIKTGSPFAMTFVNTLANIGSTNSDGHKGYIPSQLGYDNGGYSTDITDYIEGTGEVLVADYLDMLQQLKDQESMPSTNLVHCVCSDPTSTGNPCADAGHIQRTWRLWKDTTTVPYLPGYWYLGSDLDLTTGDEHNYANGNLITTTGIIGWDTDGDPYDRNIEVYVDLNGKTVNGRTGHRIYRMEDNETYTYSLTITDSVGNGKLISRTSQNSTVQGNVVWQRGPKNILTVYNGVLDGRNSHAVSTVIGGTISAAGRVNFYGGKVYSTPGGAKGPVMYIDSHSKSVITGATVLSGSTSKDVYINENNRITIGGSISVSSFYLANNVRLLNGGLTTKAKIGINAAKYGTFMSDYAADCIRCFTSKVTGASIKANTNGTLAFVSSSGSGLNTSTHNAHCVCGDTSCSDHEMLDGEWIPWDGKSAITVSGNYYLTQDLTGSTQRWIGILYALNGYTVNLCLNGHSISSNYRTLAVASNMHLNLMNCAGTGGVLRGCCANNDYAGSFWVQANASACMYDNVHIVGDVRSDRTVRMGGAVVIYGTFDMYGGSITGGKVSVIDGYVESGRGGAVYISGSAAKMTLHDGTITGGNAIYGGCIAVGNYAQMDIKGGSISGGQAEKGGGLYVVTGSTVTLSGNPQIDGCKDNYANADIITEDCGLAIAPDGLSEDVNLTIYMENPGTFCEAEPGYADRFTALVEDYSIIQNGNYIQFSDSDHAPHCACGNTDSIYCDHLPNGNAWSPWNGNTNITKPGNYFLTTNATLSKEIYIGDPDAAIHEPMEIVICLNGHTLTSSARLMQIVDGVKLTLCSCESDKESYLIGSGNANSDGGVILINTSGTLKLYSGVNIVFKQTANTVKNGGAISCLGSLLMYGGKIYAEHADKSDTSTAIKGGGGIVYVSRRFEMYSGTIYNGLASTGGGNIFVDINGTFRMYDGSITDGRTKGGHGGNVRVYGAFYMTSGTITGGNNIGTTSDNCGGNLYLGENTAHATITGNSKIIGGEAPIRAGNVFIYAGYLTISGNAEITGGAVRSTSGYAPCILQNNLVGGKYEGNIHFEGSPVVTDAYIYGGYITFSKLTDGASIGLSKKATGYLTESPVDESIMDYVHSNMKTNILSPAPDGLRLVGIATAVTINGHSYCLEDAIAAAGGKPHVITLTKNISTNVSVTDDIYLDLNGYAITAKVTIASGKTLYLIDSATADYVAKDRGKIKGTVTGTIATTTSTPESYGHNYRYITIQESDGYWSSHRFYLTVKSAIVRPCIQNNGGIQSSVNYRTVLKTNEILVKYISEYGAKVTGNTTVYANYLTSGNTLQNGVANEMVTQLAGTLDSTKSLSENKANALLVPQVNAYIKLTNGTEVNSTTISKSFRDLIVQIDAMENLSRSEKYYLGTMYRTFQEVFDSWTDTELNNIKTY